MRLREEIEHELAELEALEELGLVDEYELRRAELEAWLYALEEQRRKRGRRGEEMRGYYICDEFVETGLVFDDLRRRERIVSELFSAFRECVGVEADEVDFLRSVMARDWVVLEYEVRAKIGTLRARVVFTDGDPKKALEEAERVSWSGGGL